MDSTSILPLFSTVLVLSVILTYVLTKYRATHPLPPGPPGLPLVGNVLNAPSQFEWIRYAQWAKEYKSDLIFLQVFGTGMLVLSRQEDAEELLEKRSAIYSNRPSIPMMDIIGNSKVVVPVMPYCEHWKDCRKVFHREVESKTVLHRPREIAATLRLLVRLCDSEGSNTDSSVWKLWSSDVVLSLAYGIEVLPQDDPFVKIADEAAASFTMAGQPGSFLVNVLPFLRHVPAWVPGAGFQRKIVTWRRAIYALADAPFKAIQEKITLGQDVRSSIASRMIPTLETQDSEGYSKDSVILRDTLANIFAAGPDLAVAMETFLLAMVMNPSAAQKAQHALDQKIQSDLPSFSDFSDQQIPYLEALVNEVLRWNPIAPLAMPHATTADDFYKGYFIPKGTIVMANVYSMLRDEKVYGPETHIFRPERFLDAEGNVNANVPAPDAAFGFGRRKCAGRHMAREVLLLVIASVLWCFDILKARDHKGEVLQPSGRYISGAVCRPEPFQCIFKLRSTHLRQLILESADE